MTRELQRSPDWSAGRVATAACLCLLPLCAGCGVGGLVGGIVAGVTASSDGGNSGAQASLEPQVSFLSAPDRDQLRARGDATTIPLCVALSGAELSDLLLEYSTEKDGFAAWHPGTVLEQSTRQQPSGAEVVPCAGSVLWWDAGADLDETDVSTSVIARVSLPQSDSTFVESRPFRIGNTAPSVAFLHDEGAEVRGAFFLQIRLQDEDEDPLTNTRIEYESRPGVWTSYCSSSDASCTACPGIELADELSITRRGVTLNRRWDSLCAFGIGARNVQVNVRFSGTDPFGVLVEQTITFDVRNNQAPRVEILGTPGDLDNSFEVPVFFKLQEFDCRPTADGRDCDSHPPVDVVVQHARRGEPFPDLPPSVLQDAELRRLILTAIDSGSDAFELRRGLGIATPVLRGRRASDLTNLTASPEGVEHVFLWNSAADIAADSRTSRRLRFTPVDTVDPLAGLAQTRDITVDNTVLSDRSDVVADSGRVGGVAIGDIDSDGDADLVLSMTEQNALAIFLKQVDGAFGAVSAPMAAALEDIDTPTQVEVADVNGDGHADLIVLQRRCDNDPCSTRSDINIYRNIPHLSGRMLSPEPTRLAAGHDARSITVGRFDDDCWPDIAVSNREDRTVGIFINRSRDPAIVDPSPPIDFAAMQTVSVGTQANERPGQLLCGNFDTDPEDEIAVTKTGSDEVVIVEWQGAPTRVAQLTRASHTFERPTSLVAADFDEDGTVDLAIGTVDSSVVILRNTNAPVPTFVPCAEFTLDTVPDRLTAYSIGPQRHMFAAWGEATGSGALQLVRCEFGTDCSTMSTERVDAVRFSYPTAGGAVVAGDVDFDHVTDLLVGGADGALLLRGERAGSLALAPQLRKEVELQLTDVDAIDFPSFGCAHRRSIVALHSELLPDAQFRYRLSAFLQDGETGLEDGATWESEFSTVTQQSLSVSAGSFTNEKSCSDLIAVTREGGVDVFVGTGSVLPKTPIRIEESSIFGSPVMVGSFFASNSRDIVVLTSDAETGRLLLFSVDEAAGPIDVIQRKSLATEASTPIAYRRSGCQCRRP